jgi:hypothetical protein
MNHRKGAMKHRVAKKNAICCKNVFLSPSQGMMPELLRIFFLSHFGLEAKAHPAKSRAYRRGDFIMHNADYPLPKLKGKNYCLGIYKSDWNTEKILFWKRTGATSFFDLNDPLESWIVLFKEMVSGKSPFGTISLKKKI